MSVVDSEAAVVVVAVIEIDAWASYGWVRRHGEPLRIPWACREAAVAVGSTAGTRRAGTAELIRGTAVVVVTAGGHRHLVTAIPGVVVVGTGLHPQLGALATVTALHRLSRARRMAGTGRTAGHHQGRHCLCILPLLRRLAVVVGIRAWAPHMAAHHRPMTPMHVMAAATTHMEAPRRTPATARLSLVRHGLREAPFSHPSGRRHRRTAGEVCTARRQGVATLERPRLARRHRLTRVVTRTRCCSATRGKAHNSHRHPTRLSKVAGGGDEPLGSALRGCSITGSCKRADTWCVSCASSQEECLMFVGVARLASFLHPLPVTHAKRSLLQVVN